MNKKLKQHQSIIPGHSIGASVVGKDINFALRNWKRKLKSADTLNILKDKKEFIKPSVTKRQQMIQASYKQRMQSLNDQD
jgi:small subunit ribosomal protein S21